MQKDQIIRLQTQRKNIQITNSISIVIKPSINKVLDISRVANQKQKIQQIPIKKEPKSPETAIINNRPKNIQKQSNNIIIRNINKPSQKTSRKGQVTYVTRDITNESKDRISKIKNAGVGKCLVIIGNGPSVLEIDTPKLRNHNNIDILSINQPDIRIWPTNYWAFFDRSQINRHKKIWEGYDGTILNSTSIKEQTRKSMQFKMLGNEGFSRDMMKGIYIGRSSVYASMQIALWMNYNEVFIFGCDMDPSGLNGNLHFYGTNPDVEPRIRASRFERESKSYEIAAEVLNIDERKKFIFCSDYNKWPFIEKFERLSHSIAIDHIVAKYGK